MYTVTLSAKTQNFTTNFECFDGIYCRIAVLPLVPTKVSSTQMSLVLEISPEQCVRIIKKMFELVVWTGLLKTLVNFNQWLKIPFPVVQFRPVVKQCCSKVNHWLICLTNDELLAKVNHFSKMG